MNESTNTNRDGNDTQSKILRQIRDLGDALERAGESIERKGWESIGQAIYKLGDTLEHLNEKVGKKSSAKDSADRSASSSSSSSGNDLSSKGRDDFSSNGLKGTTSSSSSVSGSGASVGTAGSGTSFGTGTSSGMSSGSDTFSSSGSSMSSGSKPSTEEHPLGASRADSFHDSDTALPSEQSGKATVSSTGSERQSNQSFTKNPTSVNPGAKSDAQGNRSL